MPKGLQLHLRAMQLQQWLESNAKPYQEGVHLFVDHGGSVTLAEIFHGGETFYNRKRLYKELTRLACQQSAPPEVSRTEAPPPAHPAKSQRSHTPKGNFPKQLHPVCERRDELYAIINQLHPQLDLLYNQDRGECYQVAKAINIAWEEMDTVYRILDYYEDHKEILPNEYTGYHTIPQTLAEQIRRRNNLRTYIARDKSKPSKAAKVKEWREELEVLDKVLE